MGAEDFYAMMPATLLAKTLTVARRFSPTVVAATPGRLVARGVGMQIEVASPQVVDTFCCQDLPSLSSFSKGLRGLIEVVSDGKRTLLVARGRELEVRPLTTRLWDPRTGPAFSIRLSRAALVEAVDRFARRDATCLLHYTADALCLDDEAGSSSISDRRRSAGPVRVARAVSGQLLRHVAMALRTDDLEMRILGPWNGAGPVVVSECEEVGGSRLTVAFAADSYKRVRHLSLRANTQRQTDEAIYAGLTEVECEQVAAAEEQERTAEWVQTRQWDLYRLGEMAENEDRRDERMELVEHLEWEATKHRRKFADGCQVADCDVCTAKSRALALVAEHLPLQ